jgi:large subunit ribosomal protein L30e
MKTLEKVIKDAVAGDKYESGTKQVLQSLKGSKLVIVSRSIRNAERTKLAEQVKSAGIELYEYPGNSVQLGKLCNKPFRITAIALKTGSPDQINAILSETKEGASESGKGAKT